MVPPTHCVNTILHIVFFSFSVFCIFVHFGIRTNYSDKDTVFSFWYFFTNKKHFGIFIPITAISPLHFHFCILYQFQYTIVIRTLYFQIGIFVPITVKEHLITSVSLLTQVITTDFDIS